MCASETFRLPCHADRAYQATSNLIRLYLRSGWNDSVGSGLGFKLVFRDREQIALTAHRFDDLGVVGVVPD